MEFLLALILAAFSQIHGDVAVVHPDPVQNEALHELAELPVHCFVVPNDCY